MWKLRFSFLVCVLYVVSMGVLGLSVLFGQVAVGQQVRLSVVNVDTGLSYSGVQEAIDAVQTLNGHTIQVGSGVFREHVVVNKSVSLVGGGPDASVIDGGGGGVVVRVACDRVEIRNFCIQNGTFGLWVDSSNGSRVIDNRLYRGSYGIRLYHSNNSLVVGNHVSGYSFFGVELDSSGNSTLRNNVMVDNRYNFGVDGRVLQDFVNDIDASNIVDGKAMRYLVNQRDLTIRSTSFDGIGYLSVVNSSNVRVEDLDVQNNVQGVLCAFVKNLSVSNVNAQENWNGIYVVFSPNASVTGVKANHNFDYGIKFFWSPGSRAFGNNVDNNGWAGIGLFGSSNSVLELNEASFATYDLHLVYTNNSVVTRNTALARSSGYSIALYYAHNNLIFRNTFDSCLLFVETRNWTTFVPGNRWDDGVEGNRWRFYGGRDFDQDGVGDVAYNVGENNVDGFPLMGGFTEFSVVLGEKVYDFGVVSNSTIGEFHFSANDKTVSFSAVGRNGTEGFCRISIPAGFLDDLGVADLGFLVNGEEPTVVRQWTDAGYVYWYLSSVNSVFQEAFDPLFVPMVFFLLVLLGLALVVLWRRRGSKV